MAVQGQRVHEKAGAVSEAGFEILERQPEREEPRTESKGEDHRGEQRRSAGPQGLARFHEG